MPKNEERGYISYSFEKALKYIFAKAEDGKLREIDKLIRISKGKSRKYLNELKRFVDKNGVNSITYWGLIQECQSVELLKDIYAVMDMLDTVKVNAETGAIIKPKKK